jgi:hypothetical protein
MIRNMLAVAVVVVLGGVVVAAEIKSGPQSGEKVPGPFHPLNVTGEDAGKKACLYCKNGENPVAVVFARTADDPNVTRLIKALDKATEQNTKCEMGSFVVYLSGDEKLEGKLKQMAQKEGLKQIVLSIESPTGPEKYNINKDADVTVLLYAERTVKANYAFEKGKLDAKAIDQIVKDVSKITPAK